VTRYLLVSRSAEYETRLRRLLRARLQSIPGEYLTFGASEVVNRVVDKPRVALLGPLMSFEETSALSKSLGEKFPGIGLIVVREQRSDLEDWVDGIEIHAVLSPEANDSTTEALLERLDGWLTASGRLPESPEEVGDDDSSDAVSLINLEFERDVADDGGGEIDTDLEVETEPPAEEWVLPPIDDNVRTEVIVVAAPKGGQGKTTAAINLAAGLAEVEPNSVVLVDADVQFGDIANALDLDTHYSLADVVHAGNDEVALKALLTHHEDDFFVIPAPPSPELADGISGDSLGAVLARLAGMFRYVIVDTTPGMGELTLIALECATDGLFITSLTVPSLRALRKEFELLVALELVPAKRHVILNFVEKNTGLLVKDAEKILGAPIDIEIPRSIGVVLASNAGVPVIHHDVRDAAAKALRSIVQRIDPNAVPTRKRIHRKARAQ
jgi:MinD-like ATPase involved in chromosome partitioning or flagellar assembly